MVKLLILADDFTGALDTGVQFAARGAITRVVANTNCEFSELEDDVQVLVVAAESRHLPPEAARELVLQTVRRALDAGVDYVYKKTDSALRGNIGAELSAVLEAAGADSLAFVPALPKMRRTTRNGVHYIDGIPVAESVFGQDPFEPIRKSSVPEIIAEQSGVPVLLHRSDDTGAWEHAGVQVYDAETGGDLRRIAARLGPERLRLSAGCAGFAEALADVLGLDGPAPLLPKLEPALLIVCGSMNPVTLRQMSAAEDAGFPHIHLTPVQKLEPAWLETPECERQLSAWLAQAAEAGRFILDVNDPAGGNSTQEYARAHGLSTEDMRLRISGQLAALTRRLLDKGLNATVLCTGGDTLLALTRAVGADRLAPICEAAPGVVLTDFVYRERAYHIFAKSGGFGDPDLFCELAALVGAGNYKEDASC